MCVSTIGSYSTFGKIVKKHGKTQVESLFLGFSLIFDFSVYLKNSSRITFPPSGGGPCSRSLWCSKELGGRPGGRYGRPAGRYGRYGRPAGRAGGRLSCIRYPGRDLVIHEQSVTCRALHHSSTHALINIQHLRAP